MTDVELEPLDPQAATEMLRERAARRSSVIRSAVQLNSVKEYLAISAASLLLIIILAASLLLTPATVAGFVVPIILLATFGIVVFTFRSSDQRWDITALMICGITVFSAAGLAWAGQYVQGVALTELQVENAGLAQDNSTKAKELAAAADLRQRLKESSDTCEALRSEDGRRSAHFEQQLKDERDSLAKARADATQAAAKADELAKSAENLQKQLVAEKEAHAKAAQTADDVANTKKAVSDDMEGTERQLQRAKNDLQNEKAAREKAEKEERDLADKLKHAQDNDKSAAMKKDYENQLKQLRDQLSQAQKRIQDLEQQLAKHHK